MILIKNKDTASSFFGKVILLIKKVYKKRFDLANTARDVVVYNLKPNNFSATPNEVQIALTYHCNSKCIMCNIWKMKPKNELSYQEWQRLMTDPIFNKTRKLSITGGEATLHPEFEKTILLFINSMPKLKKISLVSNGFATKLIVKKIKAIAKICQLRGIALYITISLDGVSKMHEKIRRVPNAFKLTTKTILELKKLESELGFSVNGASLVLKNNLTEVDKIKKWYGDHQINYNFQIVGFHPTYVNNLDTQKGVDFNKNDLRLFKFLSQMSKMKSWLNFRAYYWRDLLAMYKEGRPRTTPCPFLRDQFSIDSLGKVYYCFSTKSIGNWRKEKSINKIYFNKKNVAFRKKIKSSACLSCNSGCNVSGAIIRDVKKYLWFKITGKPLYKTKPLS